MADATTVGTGFFTDPLGGLDDATWDGLARERFYSSAFWLRLCAVEGGGVFGGAHAALPGGGRAAAPLIGVGDGAHANCRWGELLRARGLPAPDPHGILVGQLRGYLTHLLATEGADPVTVAAALLDAVRSAAAPVPGAAPTRMALYLTTPDVLALRAAGVRALPVALTTDAWIDIPPGGWESFLRSAGSAHRARRIRVESRRFAQAGYRVRQLPLPEAYRDVARLAVRTERRYGRQADLDVYTAAFGRQAELAGDRGQVLLCGLGDAPPVGCCLFYPDGDTLYLRAVGFDYERLCGAAEYFNLTYYLPAQMPGVRHLHAGTETPEGKALRGARLDPLWLLDLSEDSVLAGVPAEIRAHNTAFRDRLVSGSPAVAGALRLADCDEFFGG